MNQAGPVRQELENELRVALRRFQGKVASRKLLAEVQAVTNKVMTDYVRAFGPRPILEEMRGNQGRRFLSLRIEMPLLFPPEEP